MNKNDILQQIVKEGYKKVDIQTMKDDSFNLKPYMKELNVFDARMKFKLNSFMTPTVKMNFQSDSEFARELWTCPGCSEPGDVTGCSDTSCSAQAMRLSGRTRICQQTRGLLLISSRLSSKDRTVMKNKGCE